MVLIGFYKGENNETQSTENIKSFDRHRGTLDRLFHPPLPPPVATEAPAAATVATEAPTNAPVQPMVLRMGITASLAVEDTQMTAYTADQAVLLNIFEPLTRRDSGGQLQPRLALSWTNVDPTTWEFKLRENVTFQNGEPFNPDAVKYSLERVFAPGSKSPIVEMADFDSVEVVDPYTVRIRAKEADPYVPDKVALFGGMIVPPQYIEKNGEEFFNSNPVGTEPFMFKEWVKDNH